MEMENSQEKVDEIIIWIPWKWVIFTQLFDCAE